MSLLDPREKHICLKLVYYGPALGGKTTSLKHIHRVIDPEGKTKLVSLDTDQDRTLFFDFLPIEVGLIGAYKVKIQGFTVPGQVKYNMTRRYVLTGADGIVFVADSDPGRVVENVESLINLGDNLRAHGLNVNDIPLVFQHNKQDLPQALRPEELDRKLNFRGVPSFATVATEGRGVFEAFVAVVKAMVSRVLREYKLEEERAREREILAEVEERLYGLAGREPPREAPADPNPGRSDPDPASAEAQEFFASFRDSPEVEPERAGVEPEPEPQPDPEPVAVPPSEPTSVAGPCAHLNARRLFRWFLATGQALAERRPLRACTQVALGAAAEALDGVGASLLLRDRANGGLKAWAVRGFRSDPLAATGPEAAALLDTLEQGADQVVLSQGGSREILARLRARHGMLRDVACAPLIVSGRVHGLLAVYLEEPVSLTAQREGLKVLLVLAHQTAAALRIEFLMRAARTGESDRAVRTAS